MSSHFDAERVNALYMTEEQTADAFGVSIEALRRWSDSYSGIKPADKEGRYVRAIVERVLRGESGRVTRP